MLLYLFLFLFCFEQQPWPSYGDAARYSFTVPVKMQLIEEEAVTTMGTIQVATFTADSLSSQGLQYLVNHYDYPEDILLLLEEEPDLRDTLLVHMSSSIMIQDGSQFDYNSLERCGKYNCIQYRFLQEDGRYRKGRAVFAHAAMYVMQVSGSKEALKSKEVDAFFNSLSIKED